MNRFNLSKSMLVHWSLYAAIVLLMLGIGLGISVTHNLLLDRVTEVDHLKTDSDLSQQSILNAKRLGRILEDNKDSVNRAADIVADTKYYQYQDQIVQDVTSYASASGLTVLGFGFTSSNPSRSSSIKGLKTVVATVSLKSPVPYTNYLRFLKLIERNLTKMQVSELAISNDLKSPNTISSPVVTLEVYVR